MTRLASQHNFQSARRGARTEAIMQQRSGHGNNQPEYRRHKDNDPESFALYGHASMVMDEGRKRPAANLAVVIWVVPRKRFPLVRYSGNGDPRYKRNRIEPGGGVSNRISRNSSHCGRRSGVDVRTGAGLG